MDVVIDCPCCGGDETCDCLVDMLTVPSTLTLTATVGVATQSWGLTLTGGLVTDPEYQCDPGGPHELLVGVSGYGGVWLVDTPDDFIPCTYPSDPECDVVISPCAVIIHCNEEFGCTYPCITFTILVNEFQRREGPICTGGVSTPTACLSLGPVYGTATAPGSPTVECDSGDDRALVFEITP